MKLSGRITRSTDECEMSRSCHSATFSIAACALARTRRARPQTCSHPIGLRLCGIADEPFCPFAERLLDLARSRCAAGGGSRGRTSRATRAASASAARNSAWRSRWMICVETGAGRRPRRAQHVRLDRRVEVARRCRRRRTASPRARSRAPRRSALGGRGRASAYHSGQLQSEGDRLGVHAVRAADHRRVAVLVGTGPRPRHAASRCRPGPRPTPRSSGAPARCR